MLWGVLLHCTISCMLLGFIWGSFSRAEPFPSNTNWLTMCCNNCSKLLWRKCFWLKWSSTLTTAEQWDHAYFQLIGCRLHQPNSTSADRFKMTVTITNHIQTSQSDSLHDVTAHTLALLIIHTTAAVDSSGGWAKNLRASCLWIMSGFRLWYSYYWITAYCFSGFHCALPAESHAARLDLFSL